MTQPPDPRVDELRQQLRSLGYLDAGVDRFLLGSARREGRPLALAARTSVRVGLLGGVLLGPAAALGVGARLPGLISGVRDALVIAVYLALLFFVAVTVVSFALSAIGALALRTRGASFRLKAEATERLSRAAGFVLTLASVTYLTLWWRNANAGFGWSAPAWTAFALLVAVAISLLLGHAQRITTLAVLAAAAGPAASLPAITNRSWRGILAGGALAFAGAAGLLLAIAPTEPLPASNQPTFGVVSPHRVYLIALDGFDPTTYEQLRDTLPNLKAALTGWQVHLQPDDTTDPARAWTTIATGVEPDVHGVHAIETRRVAGVRGVISRGGSLARALSAATDVLRLTRPSIASAEERKAKTIWEVAEQAGLRTAVVNWWATWPVPPTAGTVITDRGILRLELGGTLDGEISPPSLYESLRSQWPALRARAHDAAVQAFPGTPAAADVTAILQRSAELDAIVAGLAGTVATPQLDLTVVYLPGLDIAQNALLGESAGALAPSTMASRVDALRGYYTYLDTIVGQLLEAGTGQNIVTLTQPGRVRGSRSGLLAVASGDRDQSVGDLFHQATITVIERPARVLDVAPTVLFALGLPISRELGGTAIPELFGGQPATVDRFVPSYGRPFAAPTARGGKPLDQETIDRLRSLGYIK